LIYTLLIAGWEAGPAGMVAVVATFAVAAFQRQTRAGAAAIWKSVEDTGRTMLDIVAITALAGIVIGTLNFSGFIFKISMLLVSVSGGHALLLLVLTALGCLFLGLPLPTTVVYVTLAVLVAPALVQVGILPLAAHLFLFYFGMISLITPPDCLPTYTAAAIARADFWKTGWTGMRLASVAYIVPFVFALQPALLLIGSVAQIVLAVVGAVIGVVLIAIASAGYLFRPLGPARRAVAGGAGLCLFGLPAGGWGAGAAALGLAAGTGLVLWEWNARPPGLPAARASMERA
jgi:TRAP-type uncharacterized transport system fused permease subunit